MYFKRGSKGLSLIVISNIIFEFLISVLKHNDVYIYEFYRLCSMRYFALGCFLYYYKNWKLSLWRLSF